MKLSICLFLLFGGIDGGKRKNKLLAKPHEPIRVVRTREEEVQDIEEIMSSMSFDGWNITDYGRNYRKLILSFDAEHKPVAPVQSEDGEFMEGERSHRQAHTDRKLLMRSTSGPQMTQEDKMFMMRYLQLKYSILFLQKQKFIGKYCFYGCWCLPNGATDLGVGTGPPVDNIDKSCREYTTCYNCMYNERIGGYCNDQMVGKYNIAGRQDPTTGQVFLMCMDPAGSCNRQRCECDRSLAEKLSQYEPEWNIQNHRRWGQPPFDYEFNCKAQEVHSAYLATPPPLQLQQNFAQPQAQPAMSADSQAGFDPRHQQTPAAPVYAAPSYPASPAQNIMRSPEVVFVPAVQQQPQQQTVQTVHVVQNAPTYGQIVGCCGRSPFVHYWREGQKCCPNGSIVDGNAQCTI